MKNEAGLRPMKRGFATRRSNIALRFMAAKPPLHASQRLAIPLGFNHLLPAIHTGNPHCPRRSHAHAATGADIFARARYSWRLGDIRAAVVCAGLAGVEDRTNKKRLTFPPTYRIITSTKPGRQNRSVLSQFPGLPCYGTRTRRT